MKERQRMRERERGGGASGSMQRRAKTRGNRRSRLLFFSLPLALAHLRMIRMQLRVSYLYRGKDLRTVSRRYLTFVYAL